MQGIFRKENTDKALKYGIYRHLPTYEKIIRNLVSFYSKNIIYPKYRGLVPIAAFYEYFNSGRCDTLTGHEGAYNIYETEIRMNIIIAKLDDCLLYTSDAADE